MKTATKVVPMLRGHRALVVAALFVVLAAACGGSSSSPTGPYGGGSSGGGAGGTLFNFGPFALGQSVKFTFANAGSFGYHCITHRNMGMTGTVQVDAAGADSIVVQLGANNGFTFAPATAHIKPGGYVRWVNVSNLTVHTVTSNT